MPPQVGVVGSGYWGKNLVRVFYGRGALRWICDSEPARLREAAEQYPRVRTTRVLDDVLADDTVRALVVATPAATHTDLAARALAAGKDLFVEKPLALAYSEGEHLVREAARRNRILMVGHVLQYHPAIVRLEEIAASGELGDLYYLYSNRLNLGRARREENILWSFAPHDISVMLQLAGKLPASVAAFGGNYLRPDVADVTMCAYTFDSALRAHIFVSWLHPFKEQRLVVVGSRKMAVFDDVALDGKLCIYDKGIEWDGQEARARRAADTLVAIPAHEPLDLECAHFLECVERRVSPKTDGAEALRVLRVLESTQQSLASGQLVALSTAGVSAGA